MINLKPTWRWFGPTDPISLQAIKQTGATGIVTALHHIPNGTAWGVTEIDERKRTIEAEGLEWSVVESVPVHEAIKSRSNDYGGYINNYKESLRNLGQCGITTVCYNFMPVLDWTRTSLAYILPDKRKALRLDMTALAAFDICILKRQRAENDYLPEVKKKAVSYFEQLSGADIKSLTDTIISGLPGSEENYSLEDFKRSLQRYDGMITDDLKSNLFEFLQEIIPVAEENGIRMCIHPDDPPFSLFGLPRVISTENDIAELLTAYNSVSNGLTFCTGSLGVRKANDLLGIIRRYGDRIHFAHLRNVKVEEDGSFYESGHLAGDVDLYEIVKALVEEQQQRMASGRADIAIPFRPDHGLNMLDDFNRITNPGYPLVGRLRGLAEIIGLEMGIRRSLYQ
jgi:mannonate dehydratase